MDHWLYIVCVQSCPQYPYTPKSWLFLHWQHCQVENYTLLALIVPTLTITLLTGSLMYDLGNRLAL